MAWTNLYENKTLVTGTHWTEPITLWDNKTHHAFEYLLTGSGTMTITPYTSISGKTWVSNGVKVSGVGATSGPDTDGLDNIPMSLYPSELIKFKVVVSSDSIVLSLWFSQK